MEGTVEERVLDIQTEKRELVTKAFKEKGKGGKKTKETRLADINRLLGGAGPAPAVAPGGDGEGEGEEVDERG